MPKRSRIPLNPTQAGLNSALAGLEMPGLPEGPVEPAPSAIPSPKRPGRVMLRREKAGRGGKTVTVIEGFAPHLNERDLEDLARQLRSQCGSGGAVKGRTIEVQGDLPGKLRKLLEALGFQVAGGH